MIFPETRLDITYMIYHMDYIIWTTSKTYEICLKAAADKFGPIESYELCPRAKIFRRDGPKVSSFQVGSHLLTFILLVIGWEPN